MSLVLSHRTALELYRSSIMPLSGFARVPFESLSVPTSDDVAFYRSLPIRTAHFPLHCVVSEPKNRRNVKGGHCHVLGADMKAICLRQSNEGSLLCVVSPEVLFLQMAAQLSLIELVRLGYELCGSYSLPMAQPNYAGTPRGFSRRSPLTSVAKLNAHIVQQGNNRNVKNARVALRYVVDGAASPRETELCMLMVFPRKMGGYGLGVPSIRHKRVMSADSAFRLTSGCRSFSLCWREAGIAVAYADKASAGENELPKRRRRRCDAADYETVSSIDISSRDIRRVENLDRVADLVARGHGRYLRRDMQYDFASRQTALRDQVLNSM